MPCPRATPMGPEQHRLSPEISERFELVDASREDWNWAAGWLERQATGVDAGTTTALTKMSRYRRLDLADPASGAAAWRARGRSPSTLRCPVRLSRGGVDRSAATKPRRRGGSSRRFWRAGRASGSRSRRSGAGCSAGTPSSRASTAAGHIHDRTSLVSRDHRAVDGRPRPFVDLWLRATLTKTFAPGEHGRPVAVDQRHANPNLDQPHRPCGGGRSGRP